MSIYDKLLELINQDNPSLVPFDLTNISFSEPVIDIGNNWNTKITVNSVPGSGYVGSVDLFYHRIDLADFGTGIWLFSDIQFTKDLIVSLLNTNRNAFLLVSDIEDINIPDMRLGDIILVPVIAQQNSINWNGQNNASLIIGFPSIADSLHMLVNTVFPTNNYLY